MRMCSICKEVKPFKDEGLEDGFYTINRKYGTPDAYCKECRKKYQAGRYNGARKKSKPEEGLISAASVLRNFLES